MRKILRSIYSYLYNHFFDKWKLIYLSISTKEFISKNIKIDKGLKIFLAKKEHYKRINNELYPFFDSEQNYFKKFIESEDEGILCYLCEKDNELIHYFLVFLDASSSPLMKTPFNRMNYPIENSAYLGNAFTSPRHRGGWVVMNVIEKIMNDMSLIYKKEKVIVLVHPGTRGAKKFYETLGFQII